MNYMDLDELSFKQVSSETLLDILIEDVKKATREAENIKNDCSQGDKEIVKELINELHEIVKHW